jgi:hypothetical protein
VADAKHAALHVRRAAGDQRDPFHEAAVRHQAALRAAQVPSSRACLPLSHRCGGLHSLPARLICSLTKPRRFLRRLHQPSPSPRPLLPPPPQRPWQRPRQDSRQSQPPLLRRS